LTGKFAPEACAGVAALLVQSIVTIKHRKFCFLRKGGKLPALNTLLKEPAR
jgi:hypothetical protein